MTAKKALHILGEFVLFCQETLRLTSKLWKRRGLFIDQCEFIGVSSMGVIFVAAIFLGGVLGYQLYVSFHLFGAEGLLGGTVGTALYKEMGPVFAAFMVAGRAGAAMAAQIASMRITEQIDALEVMAVSPQEYLVLPRVAAGFLMMPMLAVFFSSVGVIAASWVACGMLGLQYPVFWTQFVKIVDPIEMVHCLVKSAVFGALISWVGCFCGYRVSGGAHAVGMATRTTVVAASLGILFFDFLLTAYLPYGYSWFAL